MTWRFHVKKSSPYIAKSIYELKPYRQYSVTESFLSLKHFPYLIKIAFDETCIFWIHQYLELSCTSHFEGPIHHWLKITDLSNNSPKILIKIQNNKELKYEGIMKKYFILNIKFTIPHNFCKFLTNLPIISSTPK